jgi:hypothetical protein
MGHAGAISATEQGVIDLATDPRSDGAALADFFDASPSDFSDATLTDFFN